jgi:hypothetical protein
VRESPAVFCGCFARLRPSSVGHGDDGSAGFKPFGHIDAFMQCHYCDEEAAVAVEKDHIKVGLCKPHLRERMEELSDTEWLEEFQSQIDDALE